MTADGDALREAPPASGALALRRFVPGTAALLIVLAAILGSMPGFLESPLGFYDESALVLGARLMNNGLLPYVDFYTNYGPLGYDLMRPFLIVGDPGLAYRAAQIATFGGLALLLLLLVRDGPRRAGFGLLAVLAVLNLSAAAHGPHFFGFALAFATITLYAAASERTGRGAWATVLLAGAALALTGLVRPAFAAYVGGTLLVVASLAHPARPGGLRAVFGRLAGCFVCAALVAAVAWSVLFPAVSPVDAFYAALVIPTVIFRSSARAVLPYFLPSGISAWIQVGFAALISISVYLLAVSWIGATKGLGARLSVLAGAAIAGVAPLVLVVSDHPGNAMWIVSASLFGASVLALAYGRETVARSPRLQRAAFFGLGAVAFLHYLWNRADAAHLTPALALASVAALCGAPEQGRKAHRALALLFAPSAVVMLMTSYPIVHLPRAVARAASSGSGADWPASAVPSDARLAVNLADRFADPSSRFVAVASNHRQTDGSPILLFLLSARRPYTRWYSYDPGVQSSPAIQAQMVQELERSSSATAVVWRAESFGDVRPDLANAPATTPLDQRVSALYPVSLGRFGTYEVRGRPGTRAAGGTD